MMYACCGLKYKLICFQVRDAQVELRSRGADIEEMVAAAEVKDADNNRLWDQVRPDSSSYSSHTLRVRNMSWATDTTLELSFALQESPASSGVRAEQKLMRVQGTRISYELQLV